MDLWIYGFTDLRIYGFDENPTEFLILFTMTLFAPLIPFHTIYSKNNLYDDSLDSYFFVNIICIDICFSKK
jgi:hypothetical protein